MVFSPDTRVTLTLNKSTWQGAEDEKAFCALLLQTTIARVAVRLSTYPSMPETRERKPSDSQARRMSGQGPSDWQSLIGVRLREQGGVRMRRKLWDQEFHA